VTAANKWQINVDVKRCSLFFSTGAVYAGAREEKNEGREVLHI